MGAQAPGLPAAVSLDGHRAAATDPANYAGLPLAQVEADLAKLNAIFAARARAAIVNEFIAERR